MEVVIKKEKQKEVETTAMVAVGVVVLIAGVKHGLTTLVEQWRALVFLFLNLLLLAILLTSTHSSKKRGKTNVRKKKSTKRKCTTSTSRRSSSWPMQVEDLFKIEETHVLTTHECQKDQQIASPSPSPCGGGDVEVEVDEAEVDDPQVSKEELNARVESFITMFRQQLALDAKERSTHSLYL